MARVTLKDQRPAHWPDTIRYTAAVLMLVAFVTFQCSRTLWLSAIGFAFAGLAVWLLIAYLLQQLVVDTVQPVDGLTDGGDPLPVGLRAIQTWIGATIIVFLIFTPLALVAGLWIAAAFTFGLLAGFFAYAAQRYGCRQTVGIQRRVTLEMSRPA